MATRNTMTLRCGVAALLVTLLCSGSVAGPDETDPVETFGAGSAEQLRQPVLLADDRAIDELAARLTLLAREAPVDSGPVLALLPDQDPDERALAFSGRAGLRDRWLLREGLALGALLAAVGGRDTAARDRLLGWIDGKDDVLYRLAPDVRAPLHALRTAARGGQLDARALVRALHAALGDLDADARANTWFVAGTWVSLARLHIARGQRSSALAMLGEALASGLRSAQAGVLGGSAADAALAEQLDRVVAELRAERPSLKAVDAVLPQLTMIVPDRADDVPADLRHHRFTDDCRALRTMPVAAPDDRVEAARGVWRAVLAAYGRVNPGFTVQPVFVSAAARVPDAGGERHPLAPIAVICSPTGQVFIPYTLVERVFGEPAALGLGERPYPPDFFAFIVAHEMAHHLMARRPDVRDGFAGGDRDREVLADRRAAFYSRLASYSPTAVWRDDLVRALLLWDHSTAAVGASERAASARHEALWGTLERFAAYDDIYVAARMLDLAGERALALRLFEWLEHDGPFTVPEVSLSHATLLLRRAAKHAPWAKALDGIGEGQQHVPCTTFDPLHTALYDPERDQLAGAGDPRKRQQAIDDLEHAAALLTRAEAQGAAPFLVSTTRACLAAYQGDADGAARAQRRAEKALPVVLPTGETTALRARLAQNRAFVEWVGFLDGSPVPPGDNAVALEGWAQHLATEAPRFAAHPAVERLSSALQRLPDDPRIRALQPKVKTYACSETGAGPSMTPLTLPERARDTDPCPDGWRWRRSVPPIGATDRGPLDGVSTCVPADGRRGDRLVFVALPDARTSVRLRTGGGDALDGWACAGGQLTEAGVDDRGRTAWRLRRRATEVLVADGERRVRLHAAVRDDGEGE